MHSVATARSVKNTSNNYAHAHNMARTRNHTFIEFTYGLDVELNDDCTCALEINEESSLSHALSELF